MCTIHVGFGRQGGGIFSKVSNFPEVPAVWIQGEVSREHLQWYGTETGVGWGWDCRRGLWQVAEELLAPIPATPSYSCPCPQPLPSFVVLVELFAWWHGEPGWWLDSDGEKKWKRVSVVVGLYFQMDLLSSVIYHVATNTWTSTVKRLVQGWAQVSGEKAERGLWKLSWHWRWCHKRCYPNTEGVAITGVWRCVNELTFLPAS